jgi:hypothetical protein
MAVAEAGPRFVKYDPERFARFKLGATKSADSSPPIAPDAPDATLALVTIGAL